MIYRRDVIIINNININNIECKQNLFIIKENKWKKFLIIYLLDISLLYKYWYIILKWYNSIFIFIVFVFFNRINNFSIIKLFYFLYVVNDY